MLLLSSGNVAIVRIRSTTPVRLLHGLVLLLSGISGKMTTTLDLTTIFAMLVCSLLLCQCYDAYLLLVSLLISMSTSTPPCPSKPLIGYVTALLSPSYSVVSCR